MQLHRAQGRCLVEIKTEQGVDASLIENLKSRFAIQAVKQLAPVLPILSRRDPPRMM